MVQNYKWCSNGSRGTPCSAMVSPVKSHARVANITKSYAFNYYISFGSTVGRPLILPRVSFSTSIPQLGYYQCRLVMSSCHHITVDIKQLCHPKLSVSYKFSCVIIGSSTQVMSSYAAVTNLCVIFSPYVMSWQVLHRANPLRLGVKSVTSGFYFQNHRNLCRYTSFMSSVLSSPSFSSNRISRLRQFQNHLSTSTPKMSNSNSNFELSSVFNVKGKVSTKPNHFLI